MSASEIAAGVDDQRGRVSRVGWLPGHSTSEKPSPSGGGSDEQVRGAGDTTNACCPCEAACST